MADGPVVSVVVPARNEEEYLPATLESVRAQETDVPCECIVVDGDSDDRTAAVARDYGATVVEQSARGIGAARNLGARRADGDWLAFVDADTVLRPDYVDEMLAFVRDEGLAAASSRCRMTESRRAKLMELVINYAFPRLGRPVLPGFNCFVSRRAYDRVGGFPEVPNEDTAFSRRLAAREPTGYHPAVLVESSGRRVARTGLTGTLYHYLRLDVRRVRADY